jgi:hypothetical protein
VVSDWWGSHNLDQRLLVSDQVAMLGLGDAFPKGIFFSSQTSRPQTRVIYTLAGNGQGRTNGQLGGMVDLTNVVAVPFITNDSSRKPSRQATGRTSIRPSPVRSLPQPTTETSSGCCSRRRAACRPATSHQSGSSRRSRPELVSSV